MQGKWNDKNSCRLWNIWDIICFYTFKDSKTREEKYQEIIDKLTEKLALLKDDKKYVQEIKNKIVK